MTSAKKEQTIVETLEEVKTNEIRSIATKLSDEFKFDIGEGIDYSMVDDDFIDVIFTKYFVIDKKDLDHFENHAKALLDINYHLIIDEDVKQTEEEMKFHFDVVTGIYLNETLTKNRKHLMKIHGVINYLCGSYNKMV